MKWIDVTNAKSDIVKRTASLKTASVARREGFFLVEGLRSVDELIKSTAFGVEWLFIEQSLLETDARLRAYFEKRLPADTRVYRVSKDIFKKVSDTETPQGVLAVVRRTGDTVEDILKRSENPLICVVENLQDPGNAGTIMRTADAAGAAGVIATKGTVDFYSPKVVRSTMGSLLHLPIVQGADLARTVEELKANGIRVFAAALGATKYHFEADFTGPCAILIGNEGNGLTEEAIALADEKIIIPMPGSAESLNAAMAAGVVMFEAVRQRMMGNE